MKRKEDCEMNMHELIDQLCFQLRKLDKIEELAREGVEQQRPPSEVLGEIYTLVDTRTWISAPPGKEKLYLIEVVGCVEPFVHGPYPSEEERERVARIIRSTEGEEDTLFMAGVNPDGGLTTDSFLAGFFMEEEDA